MTDKNGYNYNDFLSDSSDDYPKYADGIDLEPQTEIIKEVLGCDYPNYTDGFTLNGRETDCYDEDGNFEPYSMIVHSEKQHKEIINVVNSEGECTEAHNQPFHYPPPTNLIALENVLSLAEERIGEFQSPNYTDAEIVIADDSILAVKAMLNLMKAGADLKTLEASNIALAKDDNPHEGRA